VLARERERVGPLNPRAPRSAFSPVARRGFFSSSSPLLLRLPSNSSTWPRSISGR